MFFIGVWRIQFQTSRKKLKKCIFCHPIPMIPKTQGHTTVETPPSPSKCPSYHWLSKVPGSNSKKQSSIRFWWYWKLKETLQPKYHFHPEKCFSLVFKGPGLKLKNRQNPWNSTLYPILMEQKTKGHITANIPLPLLKMFFFRWS